MAANFLRFGGFFFNAGLAVLAALIGFASYTTPSQLQFLDSETGSAVTLKESTDFGRILAARTVRVTKREFKQPKTLTHRARRRLGAVNMED